MATRICAAVGDHPCFLTVITMIPTDCKITDFCLLAFLRDCHNYFLAWQVPSKLLVENPLASMLRIHSFLAHYTVL